MTEEAQSEQEAFTNHQVFLTEMPTTAYLEYSGLEPKYRLVSIIWTSIFFGIAAVVISFIRYHGNEFLLEYGHWFYLGIAAIYIFFLLIVILEFRNKSYAVRERDLVYNEGIIWRSNIVVPYNRVQHCEINQGPVERLFDLSELKIFTAGGSSSDMSIPGLHPETANRLKEFIVMKTGLDEEE